VFGAKRLSPDARLNKSLTFLSVVKSNYSNFVSVGDSFKIASSSSGYSIYWMNIAVETAGGVAANVRLPDSYLVIYKNHTYMFLDTISRSGVVKLRADTHASIYSEFPSNEAFWSIFQLDNAMNPLVAFFVASSTPSVNKKESISFDTIFVNEGNAWDSHSAVKFVASVSGIYYCSVSSAFVPEQTMTIHMYVNNDYSYNLAQSGGSHVMNPGIDTLAISRLIELSADDMVSVHLVSDAPFSFFSDSVNWALSFSGFLYSPANNIKVCVCGLIILFLQCMCL
jgi:hypothetical protein